MTMSGGLDVLQMKEEDVLKFLAAGTHLGGTNLDFQMDQYVYKRKSDGEWLICGVYCPSNELPVICLPFGFKWGKFNNGFWFV